MPHAQISLESKQNLYQKTLVEVFIKEFNHIVDVAAGRAKPKDDFINYICNIAGIAVSGAVNSVPNPFLSGILSGLVGLGLDKFNDNRKKGKQEHISSLSDAIIQDQLRILLEQVAREASWQYEYAIHVKIADESIANFAKIGVCRILEFIATNRLILNKENLLQGLIEGPSGQFVTSSKNNSLVSAENPEEKLTAEGVYCRSGYCSLEGQYFIKTEKTKKADNAGFNQDYQNDNNNSLSKPKYTKHITNLLKTSDPKYGYMRLPLADILAYGCQPHEPSMEMKEKLKRFPSQRLMVTKKDVLEYLIYIRSNQIKISLNDYFKQKYPHIRLCVISESLVGENLDGSDFSGCDLSGISLDRCSLAGTKFNGCYLTHASLNQVNAQETDFSKAHMEYVSAEGSDFTEASLDQSDLSFASLTKSKLHFVKHMGTRWLHANIESIETENVNAKLQILQEQNEQLQKQQEEFQKTLEGHEKAIENIVTELDQANSRLAALENRQTPGQPIDQLKVRLKEHYQSKDFTKISLFKADVNENKLTLDDVYVNLVVVKEEHLINLDKNHSEAKSHNNFHNNRSHTEDSKFYASSDNAKLKSNDREQNNSIVREPVALADLFKPKQKKSTIEVKEVIEVPKKLLFIGDPGIGKSTQCRFLANQWAKGRLLQEFDWVFHIKLSDLIKYFNNESSAGKTIQQLLQRYYWHRFDISEQQSNLLWEVISLQKVLFIFDGFDEVPQCHQSFVEEILLTRSNYILASRPYATQLKREIVDEVLENVGLTSDNINEYIDKYFTHCSHDAESGKLLKIWLNHQPQVRSICYVPLYLTMLCKVWSKNKETLIAIKQFNLVDLYTALVNELLMHELSKESSNLTQMSYQAKENHPRIVLIKSFLARLAFQIRPKVDLSADGSFVWNSYLGLQKEILSLSKTISQTTLFVSSSSQDHYRVLLEKLQEIVKKSIIDDNQDNKILLEQLLDNVFLKFLNNKNDHPDDSCQFLHFSFEEYFRALYLSHHLEEEKLFIENFKYDPAWQSTWVMVAGLLRNDGKRLNRFFESLLSGKRDLYGLHETILIAQCLEACGFSEKLHANYRKQFIRYLQDWLRITIQRYRNYSIYPLVTSLAKLPLVIQAADLIGVCIQIIEKDCSDRSDPNYWCKEVAGEVLILFSDLCDIPVNIIEKNYIYFDGALGRLFRSNEAVVVAFIDKYKDKNYVIYQKLNNSLIERLIYEYKNRKLNEYTDYPLLYELTNLDEEATSLLIDKCKDDDKEVRCVSYSRLGYLYNPSEAVITTLIEGRRDEDYEVRVVIYRRLGSLSSPSDVVVTALIDGCKDNDYRAEAALKYMTLSNPSNHIMTLLLNGCRDENKSISDNFINVLGSIRLSNLSETAINMLLSECGSENHKFRCAIYRVLGTLFNPREDVIHSLFRANIDEKYEIYTVAQKSLGSISFLDPSDLLINSLLSYCKDNIYRTKSAARSILRRIKLCSPTDAAINALLTSDVEEGYFPLLYQENSNEALKYALRGCGHDNVLIRVASYRVINSMPPNAEIINALLEGRADKYGAVRAEVYKGLSNLPNPNDLIINSLLTGCYDENLSARCEAYEGLSKLSNPSDKVITTLLEGCKDKSDYTAAAAYDALGNLHNPNEAVIQALIEGCNAWSTRIRWTAYNILGNLPNPDDRVLNILFDGCKDRFVRDTAYRGLLRLRKIMINNSEFQTRLQEMLIDRSDEGYIQNIDLESLCKFYPVRIWVASSWLLRNAIREYSHAIVRTDNDHYELFINNQRINIKCPNPNQLQRDLTSLRPVPMLVLKLESMLSMFFAGISKNDKPEDLIKDVSQINQLVH